MLLEVVITVILGESSKQENGHSVQEAKSSGFVELEFQDVKYEKLKVEIRSVVSGDTP